MYKYCYGCFDILNALYLGNSSPCFVDAAKEGQSRVESGSWEPHCRSILGLLDNIHNANIFKTLLRHNIL